MKLRFHTDIDLEKLLEVEDKLKEIGVTFDAGFDLYSQQREWFLDNCSMVGAKATAFKENEGS